MPYWLVLVVLAPAAAIGAIGLLLLHRHRRARHTRLRLLAGQQRVLGEEAERRRQALAPLGPQGVEQLGAAALDALDQLHVTVIERQAHLLNYEELAHLLDCKIGSLLERVRACPSPPAFPPPKNNAPPTPQPDQRSHVPGRADRAQLEEELRSRISQLRNPPGD